MKQIHVTAAVIAALLGLAVRNGTACEGCFYECHECTKTLTNMQEPDRSIALALWFGSFSTAGNHVRLPLRARCSFRDVSQSRRSGSNPQVVLSALPRLRMTAGGVGAKD